MLKRAFSILVAILIILTIPIFQVNAQYAPNEGIYSQCALLINLDTDKIIYEKNADKHMPPTAFNKVMTAMLAFENTEDINTKMVTVSDTILDDKNLVYNSSGIVAGEQISMKDLLYNILVGSANDCCSVIAEEIGGTQSNFAKMMNERAEQLGCENTTFVNAHGMDEEEQHTTCNDMAKIAKQAIKIPGFLDMCSQTSYVVPATNKNEEHKIRTSNQMMVSTSQYYYSPVKGIKYGSTDNGGRCFISTATKDGYNYLLVLMGGPTEDSQGNDLDFISACIDAKTLYQWAFDNFKIRQLVEENTPIAEIKVKSSWDADVIHVIPESTVTALINKSIDINDQQSVQFLKNLPEYIEAPIEKGQILGSMEIVADGETLGQVNLVAAESIKRSGYLSFLDKVKEVIGQTWFKITAISIAVLLIAYVITTIIINYVKNSKKRNNNRNSKK